MGREREVTKRSPPRGIRIRHQGAKLTRVLRVPSVSVPITSNCPYFSSNSGVWRISITVSTVKVSATAFVNISWMTPGSWLNSSVATVR